MITGNYTTLICSCTASITRQAHLVLSPFLIFGWLATLSTMWLLELPLAYILSAHTSLRGFGVPWATVAGLTLGMVIFTWYYLRGRWLNPGQT